MKHYRILHVIDSLDPAQGGPPVICASLAAAQTRLGHTVQIVAHASASKTGLDCADRYAADIAVERLPPPSRVERVTGWAARRTFDGLVTQFDFLHLHGVWGSILLAAATACRHRGTPYAVVLNGMLDPWSLAQKRWKKQLALALVYRRMLDGAAFLHLGNEDERRLIDPLGLRPPGSIIPNGIDVAAAEPLPPADEFAGPRPYILFLGRLHHKKGLDYLADAFALLAAERPELHLVVAGPDGGARADFEQRIASLGLGERIRVVGPLYGREKWTALSGASAFCLPSRQEGFSVAVLEALAARVPVVVSNHCHFPEVAAAGAGRVVPLDAGAIAAGLRDALTDPTMGQAGRALVESRFTWAVAAETSIRAYDDALR